MLFLWIALGIAAILTAAFFIITYICFRMAFYAPDRDPENLEVIGVPEGEVYEPFRECIETMPRKPKPSPTKSVPLPPSMG